MVKGICFAFVVAHLHHLVKDQIVLVMDKDLVLAPNFLTQPLHVAVRVVTVICIYPVLIRRDVAIGAQIRVTNAVTF